MTTAEGFDQMIGRNVRTLRRFANMTQQELADAINARGMNLTQQAVAQIEQGRRAVKLEEALAVADALGVRLTALTARDTDIARAITRILEEASTEKVAADEDDQDLLPGVVSARSAKGLAAPIPEDAR